MVDKDREFRLMEVSPSSFSMSLELLYLACILVPEGLRVRCGQIAPKLPDYREIGQEVGAESIPNVLSANSRGNL